MRGGQWQAFYLMNELRRRGIECRLLARAGAPLAAAAAEAGIEVSALTPWRLRQWSAGSDLIHAHDAASHSMAALWGQARLVVSRRVAFPVRSGLASRWKYARAARYLAVSRAVAGCLARAGVDPAKIEIVHDGVPAGLPLGRRDGPAVALDSDDPLKGRALIEAAQVPVEFTRDLSRALGSARLFVYITETEGLGSAALLAMGHGVPVVASRAGGLPEIVRHEETGLLIDRNEPGQIRSAVLRLLNDEALAARLGQAGRSMVEREFTVAAMADATMAAYRKAAGV